MKWLLILAVVGKLAAQCGFTPSPQSYDPASGGSPIPAAAGQYTITSSDFPSNCYWVASTTVPWITSFLPAALGPGMSFTWYAAANTTNSPREGSIYVSGSPTPEKAQGGWTIPVQQLAANCIPTLSAASANAAVGGGSGSFSVQTICDWNAFSNQSWVTLSPPAYGTGGGSVGYTVAANVCVAGRTGTITAGAGTLSRSSSDNLANFTINQDGSPGNLTISPSSAALGASGGTGTVSVTTGTGCSWTAVKDVSWIVAGASGSGVANISYSVAANTGAARSGHISVSESGVTVVFTISQQAAAAPAPQLTAVANAASYASGPIAPGEIVALGGAGLGPTAGVSLQLAVGGQSVTTTLGGVQVLFDGKYAAALTYVSAGQINVIAPYEITGETNTQIQVQYQGGTSAALQAQVQPAAPGIFTLNATGLGNGAILNQDYRVNGTSYPAPRGSTIMIFCTGGGLTDPPSADAAITAELSTLAQPVGVTIGGIPVPPQQVTYAGGAPGAVAGLTQINAVVPANAPTGSQVPVVVQIGNWQSQAGVTMAVE